MTQPDKQLELERQLLQNLGGRLRILRHKKGWLEEDVARMVANEVGVSMGAAGWKRLEAGRARVPQLITLMSIAGIFETTIDELLQPVANMSEAQVFTGHAERIAQLRASEEQHRAAKTSLQEVIDFCQQQQRELDRRADAEALRAEVREREANGE